VQGRAKPAEVSGFLERLTESELAARRFGPAMWAADAETALLVNDREALLDHLDRTVRRFSATSLVGAPEEVKTLLAWPCVEETFACYLSVGSRGLGGRKLADFYRATAERVAAAQPRLAGLAYGRLAALVGEAGLTPADHYKMTFAATDPAADTARLERALAAGAAVPGRPALELLLLGRYIEGGDMTKAEALVRQIRAEGGGADTAANALYNLGLLYVSRKQFDQARSCLTSVLTDFPKTHWAEFARGYLAKLPASPAP